MNLKTALKKLEDSEVFKEFLEKDKDYFLAHCFSIVDKVQGPWQIGYYSPSKDRIVVFEVDKEISKSEEEEVFKKPGKKVEKLNIDTVKIDGEKAVKIAEKFCKEKYPAEIQKQMFLILQNISGEHYNITFTTEAFKLINVHVDTDKGNIISHKIDSIMSLKRTDM